MYRRNSGGGEAYPNNVIMH